MFAPVLRKIAENKNAYIERTLPVLGKTFIHSGDDVKPFDRIGECVYSQNVLNFSESFRPYKFTLPSKFYYLNSQLGTLEGKKILAPFNGTLLKDEIGHYIFQEAESRFILLSGVWGKVDKVIEGRSVLIKSQTTDVVLVASTPSSFSGELVVFPNPTEILERYYLESFSKGTDGKIIYVGHFADIALMQRARELGVGAVLAGSATKETFAYAKSNNVGLGIIVGFGHYETPDYIFKTLSLVSYRQVFFVGEKNLLKIPMPPQNEPVPASDASLNTQAKKPRRRVLATKYVKEVKKGLDIYSVQDPYFGKTGTVDSVLENSIFVRFDKDKEPVSINYPNFFILE